MLLLLACHCSLASMHSSALCVLECIVGHGQASDAETGDAEIGDVWTEKYGKLRNSGVLECIFGPTVRQVSAGLVKEVLSDVETFFLYISFANQTCKVSLSDLKSTSVLFHCWQANEN